MPGPRDKLLYRLRLKFKFWLAFQVLIPLVSIALLWPASELFHRPFGFERTFSGAELLLLGAFLLFGAMVDIYYEQRTNKRLNGSDRLDTFYISNFTIGVIFLLVYGCLKIYMLLYDFPRTGVTPPAKEVAYCAYTSLFGLVAAAVWASLSIHVSYRELAAPTTAGAD
jgi:hypothetical protein